MANFGLQSAMSGRTNNNMNHIATDLHCGCSTEPADVRLCVDLECIVSSGMSSQAARGVGYKLSSAVGRTASPP